MSATAFFGQLIAANSSATIEVPEDADVIITQAVVIAKTNQTTGLFLTMKGMEFSDEDEPLCVAQFNQRNPRVQLDLILSPNDQATLTVKGDGEVHLAGYYRQIAEFSDNELSEAEESSNEDQMDEDEQIDDLEGLKAKIMANKGSFKRDLGIEDEDSSSEKDKDSSDEGEDSSDAAPAPVPQKQQQKPAGGQKDGQPKKH